MCASLYSCILLTTSRWFEECLRKGCKVYHFPHGRNPRVRVLSAGSICLLLVKPKPKAPRHEWFFAGEFKVEEVSLVTGSEFRDKYAKLAVETQEVPFPKVDESSWIIVFDKLVQYEKPVKLSECSDVRTSKSKKPLSKWVITGITLIRPEDAERFVEAIRAKAGHPERFEAQPSHNDLMNKLIEIGKWLGFIVKSEESTPDGAYRIDVTWRNYEGHSPIKVFEIDVKGDIDKALARLKHAWDMWHCQLYLIVSDERKAERAKQLVEPRLTGAFAELKHRLEILGWEDIHNFYKDLQRHKELLVKLAKKEL